VDPMSEMTKPFWHWFLRERSGIVLLPRLRGIRRLVVDIPVFFLGAYLLYLWVWSFPEPGRRFTFSMLENPYALAAILCILAHQIGVSYMRDRLTLQPTFPARLLLLFPGTIQRLYEEQYGKDSLVRMLRRIGFAVALFGIAAVIVSWTRMHAQSLVLNSAPGPTAQEKGLMANTMSPTAYQTVFEIGLRSFPWGELLGPLVLSAVGVAFLLYLKKDELGRLVGGLIAIYGLIFFLLSAANFVPEFYEARQAYVRGDTSVVEGQVENFHPLPVLGGQVESFSVGGKTFSYPVGGTSPCFQDTPSHRGPIRAGLYVRVYYNDACIQRVDVRR
jgi:hypothetical protein